MSSAEFASLIAAGNTQPGGFYYNNVALRPAGAWKISDDMMHQPWGSVLRQLDGNQPYAANHQNLPSKPMSPRSALTTARRPTPALVTAQGAGKAYTHSRTTGARLAPPPGALPQYAALQGVPFMMRPFAS